MYLSRTFVPALLASVVFFTQPCAAATPSFLCTKASTWIENTICASARLSELDLDLAMVYARLLRGTDPGAKRSLESDQRKWWGERSQCQKNADPPACVEQSYTTRIGNLKARPDYPGDVAPAMGPKIIQDAPIKEAGQGWAKNLSEYFKAINLCVASARTPIQAVLSAWNEDRDMVAMWLRRQDGQNLRCAAARNGNQLKSLVDWDVGEDIHTTGPVLYLGAKEPGCASAAGVIDPIGTPLGWLIGTDCLSQEAKNAEPS